MGPVRSRPAAGKSAWRAAAAAGPWTANCCRSGTVRPRPRHGWRTSGWRPWAAGSGRRNWPPLLASCGAVRVVSCVVSFLPVSAALSLLQEGLELVWIFRLYRANGALLDRIGDRRAALWRRLARWTVAVGAVVCLLWVPVPRLYTDMGALESLPAAAVVLAYVLRAVLWAVELSSSVLWVVRWVQLWWTAETFRRLGRGEPTQ